MADLVIDLGLNTDAIVEGPEDFELGLSSAASTTGAAVSIDPAADSVTTTINDLTAPLEWSITGPVSADEGASAQYTISLVGALGAGEDASVVISLSDLTTNPNDYDDVNAAILLAISGNPDLAYDPISGTLTFTSPADGSTLSPVVIDLGIVNDAFVEGPEQFNIALLSPSSSSGAATTVSVSENNVTTEINDTLAAGQDPDFAEWVLSGDTTVDEDGIASYTLALEGQLGAGEDALINLNLANLDTTSADYQNFIAAVNTAVAAYAGDGTVTFDGTTITFTAINDGDSLSDLTFDVAAVDDVLVEGDEDFRVSITNARSTTGGEIATGTTAVTTTIIDNDSAAWSITGDASVVEGVDAKYTVNLVGTLQAGETASIELSVGDIDTTSADYANFVVAAVMTRSRLTPDRERWRLMERR